MIRHRIRLSKIQNCKMLAHIFRSSTIFPISPSSGVLFSPTYLLKISNFCQVNTVMNQYRKSSTVCENCTVLTTLCVYLIRSAPERVTCVFLWYYVITKKYKENGLHLQSELLLHVMKKIGERTTRKQKTQILFCEL